MAQVDSERILDLLRKNEVRSAGRVVTAALAQGDRETRDWILSSLEPEPIPAREELYGWIRESLLRTGEVDKAELYARMEAFVRENFPSEHDPSRDPRHTTAEQEMPLYLYQVDEAFNLALPDAELLERAVRLVRVYQEQHRQRLAELSLE